MKVLVIYPGHAMSTIDVAEGWANGLEAAGLDVRRFHYHNVLAFYSEAFRRWKELTPSFEYKDGDILFMASRAAIADIVQFPPDVVIVVTGLAVHIVLYEALKKLTVPLVLILTECPYLDESQGDLCQAVKPDAIFVNDRASLGNFDGAIYLPHSFDPARHCPAYVRDKYRSDVCFIGTMYPERREIIETMNWEGIDLRLVGTKLGMVGQQLAMDKEGWITNAEAANYYRGAKICLSLNRTVKGAKDNHLEHIRECEAWSLSPRHYEIAACGGFQIAQDGRPELWEVFGDTVPTFRTARGLEELVRYYLSNDEERWRLARLQHDKVHGCSFEERARNIVIPKLEELWQKYMEKMV